jgi:hypothetical protein
VLLASRTIDELAVLRQSRSSELVCAKSGAQVPMKDIILAELVLAPNFNRDVDDHISTTHVCAVPAWTARSRLIIPF